MGFSVWVLLVVFGLNVVLSWVFFLFDFCKKNLLHNICCLKLAGSSPASTRTNCQPSRSRYLCCCKRQRPRSGFIFLHEGEDEEEGLVDGEGSRDNLSKGLDFVQKNIYDTRRSKFALHVFILMQTLCMVFLYSSFLLSPKNFQPFFPPGLGTNQSLVAPLSPFESVFFYNDNFGVNFFFTREYYHFRSKFLRDCPQDFMYTLSSSSSNGYDDPKPVVYQDNCLLNPSKSSICRCGTFFNSRIFKKKVCDADMQKARAASFFKHATLWGLRLHSSLLFFYSLSTFCGLFIGFFAFRAIFSNSLIFLRLSFAEKYLLRFLVCAYSLVWICGVYLSSSQGSLRLQESSRGGKAWFVILQSLLFVTNSFIYFLFCVYYKRSISRQGGIYSLFLSHFLRTQSLRKLRFRKLLPRVLFTSFWVYVFFVTAVLLVFNAVLIADFGGNDETKPLFVAPDYTGLTCSSQQDFLAQNSSFNFFNLTVSSGKFSNFYEQDIFPNFFLYPVTFNFSSQISGNPHSLVYLPYTTLPYMVLRYNNKQDQSINDDGDSTDNIFKETGNVMTVLADKVGTDWHSVYSYHVYARDVWNRVIQIPTLYIFFFSDLEFWLLFSEHVSVFLLYFLMWLLPKHVLGMSKSDFRLDLWSGRGLCAFSSRFLCCKKYFYRPRRNVPYSSLQNTNYRADHGPQALALDEVGAWKLTTKILPKFLLVENSDFLVQLVSHKNRELSSPGAFTSRLPFGFHKDSPVGFGYFVTSVLQQIHSSQSSWLETAYRSYRFQKSCLLLEAERGKLSNKFLKDFFLDFSTVLLEEKTMSLDLGSCSGKSRVKTTVTARDILRIKIRLLECLQVKFGKFWFSENEETKNKVFNLRMSSMHKSFSGTDTRVVDYALALCFLSDPRFTSSVYCLHNHNYENGFFHKKCSCGPETDLWPETFDKKEHDSFLLSTSASTDKGGKSMLLNQVFQATNKHICDACQIMSVQQFSTCGSTMSLPEIRKGITKETRVLDSGGLLFDETMQGQKLSFLKGYAEFYDELFIQAKIEMLELVRVLERRPPFFKSDCDRPKDDAKTVSEELQYVQTTLLVFFEGFVSSSEKIILQVLQSLKMYTLVCRCICRHSAFCANLRIQALLDIKLTCEDADISYDDFLPFLLFTTTTNAISLKQANKIGTCAFDLEEIISKFVFWEKSLEKLMTQSAFISYKSILEAQNRTLYSYGFIKDFSVVGTEDFNQEIAALIGSELNLYSHFSLPKTASAHGVRELARTLQKSTFMKLALESYELSVAENYEHGLYWKTIEDDDHILREVLLGVSFRDKPFFFRFLRSMQLHQTSNFCLAEEEGKEKQEQVLGNSEEGTNSYQFCTNFLKQCIDFFGETQGRRGFSSKKSRDQHTTLFNFIRKSFKLMSPILKKYSFFMPSVLRPVSLFKISATLIYWSFPVDVFFFDSSLDPSFLPQTLSPAFEKREIGKKKTANSRKKKKNRLRFYGSLKYKKPQALHVARHPNIEAQTRALYTLLKLFLTVATVETCHASLPNTQQQSKSAAAVVFNCLVSDIIPRNELDLLWYFFCTPFCHISPLLLFNSWREVFSFKTMKHKTAWKPKKTTICKNCPVFCCHNFPNEFENILSPFLSCNFTFGHEFKQMTKRRSEKISLSPETLKTLRFFPEVKGEFTCSSLTNAACINTAITTTTSNDDTPGSSRTNLSSSTSNLGIYSKISSTSTSMSSSSSSSPRNWVPQMLSKRSSNLDINDHEPIENMREMRLAYKLSSKYFVFSLHIMAYFSNKATYCFNPNRPITSSDLNYFMNSCSEAKKWGQFFFSQSGGGSNYYVQPNEIDAILFILQKSIDRVLETSKKYMSGVTRREDSYISIENDDTAREEMYQNLYRLEKLKYKLKHQVAETGFLAELCSCLISCFIIFLRFS